MKQKFYILAALLLLTFNSWAQDSGNEEQQGGDESESLYLSLVEGTTNDMIFNALEDGGYMILTTGSDPYVYLSALTSGLTDEDLAVNFEYKLSRDVMDLEFFFSPVAGGREMSFSLKKADDWTAASIDISDQRSSYGWGKEDDFLRLDPGSQSGTTLFIRNITVGPYNAPKIDIDLPMADNVCQLSTAEDVEKFAKYINIDELKLDAALTADIDYTGHTTFIGTSSSFYKGTFDGKDHTITVDFNRNANDAALFEYLRGTVKNLVIKGTITTSGKYAAGVAAHTYAGSKVQNCVSLINVVSSIRGDGIHGGLVAVNESGLTIENCIYAGTMTGSTTTNCAGIVGWSTGSTTMNNCIVAADMTGLGLNDDYTFSRDPGMVTLSNCYYTGAHGTVNGGGIKLEGASDMLTSGEAAFKANGDQKNIVWYQNLTGDVDPYPVPFADHAQVYASGELRCDGIPLSADCTYSNVMSGNIPDHNFENDICTVCGTKQSDFVQQEDGWYMLGTPQQLQWFALLVNGGNCTAKAKLTADIDFTNNKVQIQDYAGNFDGQGHTITVNYLGTKSGCALFDGLQGCTIANLTIAGNITTGYTFGAGLATHSYDSSTLLKNIISLVNIHSAKSGDGTHGGILGVSDAGCTLENCIYAGTIDCDLDDDGFPITAYSGGLIGFSSSTTYLKNCLMLGKMNLLSGYNAVFSRDKSNAGTLLVLTNCYYNELPTCCTEKGGTDNGATQIQDGQLTSGELCYLLNGDQKEIKFYQNIGEDDFPVPFSSHKQVYAISVSKGTYTNNAEEVNRIIPKNPQIDSDGYYLIGSPEEYLEFANLFNSGQIEATSNAKLTADIDLTNCIDYSIGNSEHLYNGIFDGQFHTITLDMNVTTYNAAPFNRAGENSIIKNLKVNGTIKTSQQYAASIVARLYGGTIYKCSSSVKIICSCSGDVCSGGLVSVAEKGGTIKYCSFTGSLLTTNGSTNCGGLVGWCSDYTSIQGCIISPEQVSSGMIEYTVSRNTSKAEVENCYYDSSKNLGKVNSGALPMTASTTVTGEMCYMMNGDQQDIGWTQNIGFDEMPNNEGLSSQVYSNVERRCDGKIIDSVGSYSNDSSISSKVPDHNYKDGVCSVCGQTDEMYMLPNCDGVYEVSTPQQLTWISNYINNGHVNVPICLKSDIDMSSYSDKFKLIGTDKNPYSSQFDGNLHRIKNLKISMPNNNCIGFFGCIQAPCTISNLILDNTCSISGMSFCGMIGEAYPTQGEVHLSKLGNEGSVTASGYNAGGILGVCMSTSATIFIDDCYVTGAVIGNSESAAITGWAGKNAEINNTWAVCPLTGYESKEKSFARYASATLDNCYGSGAMTSQVNTITQDMLKNGQLTYLLNGERQDEPVWFQNLGSQNYPCLDKTQQAVRQYIDGSYKNADLIKELNLYDANGDGVINMVDLTTLIRYLNKETLTGTYNKSAFDCNADGKETISDIITLQNHILGKDIK